MGYVFLKKYNNGAKKPINFMSFDTDTSTFVFILTYIYTYKLKYVIC